MKTKRSTLTRVFMLCAGLATCAGFAADILSGSEELRLDFDEAMQSINETSMATRPLAKHLDQGIQNLSAAIEKVKADPNALNKSEFELAFAQSVSRVVGDMDEILARRDQTEWAFRDIVDEVVRVAKRLEYNYDKAKERRARHEEELAKMEGELTKLARQIEAKGENAPPEMKQQFRQMLRKFKIQQRTLKNLKSVEGQLGKTLSVLGQNGRSIEEGQRNLQTWFENLSMNRNAFRQLVESRKDMANLAAMMRAGGTQSLMQTFEKLRHVQQRLDEFGATFDKMDANLDVLQSFEPGALTIAEPVEMGSDEPWKDWLSEH